MLNVNQKEAMERILARQPFEASSLSGKCMNYTPGAGRLGDEYNKLIADFKTGAYVVFSYATPIAWFGANGWYVVEQKFSSTTSKTQTYVRRAIAERQAKYISFQDFLDNDLDHLEERFEAMSDEDKKVQVALALTWENNIPNCKHMGADEATRGRCLTTDCCGYYLEEVQLLVADWADYLN